MNITFVSQGSATWTRALTVTTATSPASCDMCLKRAAGAIFSVAFEFDSNCQALGGLAVRVEFKCFVSAPFSIVSAPFSIENGAETIENGAETKHLNSTRTARPPRAWQFESNSNATEKMAPAARLRHMSQDAGLVAVVTVSALVQVAEPCETKVMFIA